jgi:putative transferase (TIGR04331 family)
LKRLLVTSALEETWGVGVPVLFLGEWCRLYNRRHIWSGMDVLVAQPCDAQPEQKFSEITYIDTLVNLILTELTEVLNKYHQVQHNERYWNIVIGHWLKIYVSVAFNRYYTLDQALKNYKISGTVIIEGGNCDLATSDIRSFLDACNDDQWNHVFYSRVMTFRGDAELNPTFVSPGKANGFGDEKKNICGLSMQAIGLLLKLLDAIKSRGAGSAIIRLVEKLICEIGVKFGRDTDAFIVSSYLSVMEEIKLQLALGQIPQIWTVPRGGLTKVDPDPEVRASLKLNYDKFEGFEKYVRWQLPEVLPTCHLEGYKNLIKRAEEMPWPKRPRFIFTSNAFFTREIFKAWTALKVEQGIPYFVGQHGNNFGTHVMYGRGWPERTTCDKFITWGWTEGESDIPAFNLTNAGRKPRQFDDAGGLLLVECPLLPAIDYFDQNYEYTLYMEEQFRFAEILPARIHQKLTVRLHADYLKKRSFEDLRWKDRSPHTQLEPGIINIRELIKQNRLVVYSYDSTGILETLAMNIPTMCFWRGGLNHLLPSAKPYYELLADVGILFFSSEATAKFIALHWDDISGWWESEKVQNARQIFCDQYSRTVPHPARELKNILMASLKTARKGEE